MATGSRSLFLFLLLSRGRRPSNSLFSTSVDYRNDFTLGSAGSGRVGVKSISYRIFISFFFVASLAELTMKSMDKQTRGQAYGRPETVAGDDQSLSRQPFSLFLFFFEINQPAKEAALGWLELDAQMEC